LIAVPQHVDLGIGSVSRRILIGASPNILLEGPEASTEAVLLLLAPHLCEPVLRNRIGVPFIRPPREVGALILRDIDALSADDQTALLEWLADASPRTKIVSTTAHSLFALVARGLFDVGLYYRLNVMLLQVNSGRDVGLPVCNPIHRDESAPG
jgi:Sigma-54 interaction domain